MLIPPVLKWPGSKFSIVDWLVGHMPPHDAYLEPFFGAGAVLFNKPPAAAEMVNDRDGEVVNFFQVLRDRPDDLARVIALTPWAREEYDRCRRQPVGATGSGASNLERARRFTVMMWMAVGQRRNSPSGGTCGWRSRLRDRGAEAATWRRLPERLEIGAERILNTQIENRPALDVIQRHAEQNVLIYADPPYVHSERGRKLYAHEMTDQDHHDLLDALDAHPGPVMLSGYMSNLYKTRLPHWQAHYTTSIDQANNQRREYLWLNPVCVDRLRADRQQQRMFE